MDNSEGRPLDETEAGSEDPQGWYFDLPGGAWERQEEKNRTLRQRVLGNITEDEARAKSDPFGGRAPEPEKKAGRGFFGRRKKDDDDGTPRTSAGGTWVLDSGRAEASERLEMPEQADPDEEDWTTEPPLKLAAFQRAERKERPEWGQPDGGWDLSGRETLEAPDSIEPVAAEVVSEADTLVPAFETGLRIVEVEPESEPDAEWEFEADELSLIHI